MLQETEIKKITTVIKDFAIKAHFNVADLQQYDNTVLEKLKDKTLYEEIADINLSKFESKNFYGGENVRILKSVKNGHYIYSRYCWGD